MRFDEVNLVGDFKINGQIGDSGKAIGFSGSNISWISAASGGAPQNALASTGYNYVIVSATGSAIENGDTLREIYNNVTFNWNGSPDNTNRYTVLLMPGEYDLQNSQLNCQDYTDLVGISSNPYDTILSANGGEIFRINVYNFGLFNLYFRDGFIQDGGTATYMIWKNIVFGDGVFTSSYPLTDMIGEFEDITILGTCHFADCSGNINGIFNNINKIGTGDGFFSAMNITGTFSNIFTDYASDFFIAGLNISGTFENINTNLGNAFNGGGEVTGTYKNINIKYCSSSFLFSNDTADTVFENINIDYLDSDAFTMTGGTFQGKYKNIKIGDASSCFVSDTGFSSSAEFENIKIKSAQYVFTTTTGGNLDGTFKNIKIGDVQGNAFCSENADLYGVYSDIEVGNVGDKFFYSFNNFSANVKNVKAGNISGSDTFCSQSGTIYQIIAEDIKLGNCSGRVFLNRNGTELQGIIKNVEIGNILSDIFNIPSGGLTASNIQIGDVQKFIQIGNNNVFLNLNNIKMGNTTMVGDSGGYSYENDSTINNMIIGNVSQDVFSRRMPPVVRNMTVGNIGGSCFYTDTTINATLENITVGNVGKDFITATSSNGSISGDIRNIKAGNILGSAFSAYTDFATNIDSFSLLTIKNVEISSCKHIFRSAQDGLKSMTGVLIENVGVGTCSTAFQYTTVGSTSKVKNFSVSGVFTPDRVDGLVERSYFNMMGRNIDFGFIGTGKFERNKILVDSSRSVVFGALQQPLYNLINYGTLLNVLGSASNIIDSDITP